MTDKPIIFSGPMVRALLDGQKTQTRRILKPQPDTKNGGTIWSGTPFGPLSYNGTWPDGTRSIQSVPYAPGDRLYVREAHALVPATAYRMSQGVVQAIDPEDMDRACVYREGWERSQPGKWRPSIHMPRWASRITLTVAEVRVQRLQEISEADVLAEGCPLDPFYHDTTADGSNPHMVKIDTAKWISPRGWYHRLWDSLHGPDAWDANPWVVAVSFTVDRRNIDAIPRQD